MSGLVRGAGERPRVYGHRGTRGHPGIVENTLPAFALALDQGADGVELDVRLCGSGEVIVLHDTDLQRTAPAFTRDGAALIAAESSLSELAAAGVPSLLEALDLVLTRGATVNVEVKADVPDQGALLDAVVRVLGERPREQRAQLFVSSFSRSICRTLAQVLEDVPVLWLFGGRDRPARVEMPDDLPQLVGVHPRHTLIDAALMSEARARGAVVNTWTVNNPSEAIRLSQLGVDGIITDDVPAILGVL